MKNTGGRQKVGKSNKGNNRLEKLYQTVFVSQLSDPQLYRRIRLVQHALVEIKKFSPKEVEITEVGVGGNNESDNSDNTPTNYYYVINNLRLNLTGYLGYSKHDGEINYLVVNNGRLHWGELEGVSLLSMYNSIGVITGVNSLDELIIFLSGECDYQLTNNYIIG